MDTNNYAAPYLFHSALLYSGKLMLYLSTHNVCVDHKWGNGMDHNFSDPISHI